METKKIFSKDLRRPRRKTTHNKLNLGDRLFSYFCYGFIGLVCILTLYPFIYVISASLSPATSIMRNEVILFPKDITLYAYEVVVQYKGLWIAYANTVFYTVCGTLISLLLTVLAAYPLSRKRWKARKICSFFVVFTMWFSGGMIPFFLVIRDLDLLNTRFVILIYNAIAAFYVIIMRTYFERIPQEIEESAKLDGASDLTILFRIMLPLSLPVVAAIGLYYAVGKWNSYFWEMIFISDEGKMPVQVLLQRILLASQMGQELVKSLNKGERTIPITIQYACIIVTSLPIIVLYPFVQKYFVKGVMLGGVKG